MFLLRALSPRILKATGVTLVIVALALGLFQLGRREVLRDVEVNQLEEFIETKERIDRVQVSPDRAAAVERMRSNGLIR